MTGFEDRLIKASLATCATEIIVGLILVLTGVADWYNSHFHFFGILGFGMGAYGFWHWVFKRSSTNA